MAIFMMNNPLADNWHDRMVCDYMLDSYLNNWLPQQSTSSAFVQPFDLVHRHRPASSRPFCSRQRPAGCAQVKPNIRRSADNCKPSVFEDLLNAFFESQVANAEARPATGEQTAASNVNNSNTTAPEANNNANNQVESSSADQVAATANTTATTTTEQQQSQLTLAEHQPKKIEIDLQQFKPENVVVKVVNNRLLVEACQEQTDNGIYSKLELKRQFELGEHYDLNNIQCLYTTQGKLMIEIPRAKSEQSIVLPIRTEAVDESPQQHPEDTKQQATESANQTAIGPIDSSNTAEQTEEANNGSTKMDLELD